MMNYYYYYYVKWTKLIQFSKLKIDFPYNMCEYQICECQMCEWTWNELQK